MNQGADTDFRTTRATRDHSGTLSASRPETTTPGGPLSKKKERQMICKDCGNKFNEDEVDWQGWDGDVVPICPNCEEDAKLQEESNSRYWGMVHRYSTV